MGEDIRRALNDYYTNCIFNVVDLKFHNFKIILIIKLSFNYQIREYSIDFNYNYDTNLTLDANLSQIKYKVEKEFIKIIIKGGKK